MAAMARWCVQRRAWVLIGWLALLAVLGVTGRTAGSAYSDALTLPGTGSTTAQNLLEQAFPGHAGDQETIVWRASSGGVSAPAVRGRITAMLGQVAAAPAVASVSGPYSARGAAQVSRNGQIAYATVVFDAPQASLPVPDVTRVVHLAEAARAPGVQVDIGGPAVENALRPSVGISADVGVIAAAVVLFIAFGSLLAMLIPLIIAIFALVSGLMTTGLLSHAVTIPSAGPTLGILIGLGVGIDYALFIVTRHRTGLKSGMSPRDAAVRALNTSGRAVLFAGTTVCIALLGMLVLRISFISGLGIAAAITVLFTVAAAVTLLPALLGFLGMRVLSRRERRRLAAAGPAPDGTSGAWARLAAFIQRHPRPAGRRRGHRHARAGHPGALAAAGLLRRGQRPGRHHHPPGLRPARHRIRPGLQRPPGTGRHYYVPRGCGRVRPAGRHAEDRARHRRGLRAHYEVFLVSRIREEWAATSDNHQAVRTGQATTGRVIIAAATIMILVFSAFILYGQQAIGEIGIGLAAAVLLDAFLLRTILVPALMHLSGRANWWLPGWLASLLPHLSIEPATQPPALAAPALTRSTTAG